MGRPGGSADDRRSRPGASGDVTDHRLTRPDGRIVAWTKLGAPRRPVLRVPGTPGSRLSLRADRTPWFERGLRVITTERQGFGASTRLEGRGFDEHADDTIAILIARHRRAPVYGASGASPHILALAARHPDRITAATIVVGAAPLDPDEAAQQIDLNAEEQRLFDAGELDEIWRITDELRTELSQTRSTPFAGSWRRRPRPIGRSLRSRPGSVASWSG